MKSIFQNRKPVGPLSQLIEDYIAFKRAQGLKFNGAADCLYRFSVLSLEYDLDGTHIPQELIENYLERQPHEKAGTQKIRISYTMGFLVYAKDFGCRVIFPEIPRVRSTKYSPYIFTSHEVSLFFRACDTLPACNGSLRHETAPIFFRILYSCGLRVSEATNLKIADVDLDNGILMIRDPKNLKDRYVPMPESLTKAMRRFRYSAHDSNSNGSTYFFKGRFNDCITNANDVYRWFRMCIEKAGILHRGRGFGPRVHDLRHLFCVNSLKSMCAQGMDIYCCLPILSAYVGHKSTDATQGYLRLTAEIYPKLTEQIARYTDGVFPEAWEE